MFNNTTHKHFIPPTTATTIQRVPGFGGAPHADQSSAPSSANEVPFSSLSTPGGKKRRSSKMKSGKQLARSRSTPQMRDSAISDSDSDKKRNKLGYQRISIACAHCRRRKIRCVISDGEPSQRCQNCIRLKKDCFFYPVDQQAAMENRSESSVKLLPGSGPSSVVSVSPPNQGMDRSVDSAHDFPAFSALPSNAPSTYGTLPLEPGSALPGQGGHGLMQQPMPNYSDPSAGIFMQPDNAYRPDNSMRSWAATTMLEPGAGRMHPGRTDAPSQSIVGYASSPSLPGDYSPFPTNVASHAQEGYLGTQGFGFPQHRDGTTWQHSQPARAVSYEQVDQLSEQQQLHQSAYRHNQRQQDPIMQYSMPSLDHNPTIIHDVRGPHSAPVGAHQAYSQANPFMFQQPHESADNASQLQQQQTYPTGWYPSHYYGSFEEEPDDYGNPDHRPG